MTKEEFLKRCETIYDKGFIRPRTTSLLEKWLDFVMRFEAGQMNDVANFLAEEKERTQNFTSSKLLANDYDGYALIQLAAILSHHCQLCAEDKDAWHTRPAFCNHK